MKTVRSVAPIDPYNVTHPAQYLAGLSSTAAGLVHNLDHPMDLVKGLVGSQWGTDPGEALGRLVPNLLATAVSDGGSAAVDTVDAASIGGRAGTGIAESRGADLGETADSAGASSPPVGQRAQEPAITPHAPLTLGQSALDQSVTQQINAGLRTVENDLAKVHIHGPDVYHDRRRTRRHQHPACAATGRRGCGTTRPGILGYRAREPTGWDVADATTPRRPGHRLGCCDIPALAPIRRPPAQRPDHRRGTRSAWIAHGTAR